MIKHKEINSIETLIKEVKNDYKEWGEISFVWFRGEMEDTPYPLVPKLYRPVDGMLRHNENRLLQHFRNKAPSFSAGNTPPKNNTDEWLFLAQHSGLPTRLLDWTEGLFFALHFALNYKNPVVWMLNPFELNKQAAKQETDKDHHDPQDFPLTWFSLDMAPLTNNDLVDAINKIGDDAKVLKEEGKSTTHLKLPANIGNINIRGAWENDRLGTHLPVAIFPSYVHARMNAQRSCFTIQGKMKDSLQNLVGDKVLKKYLILPSCVEEIKKDLQTIGITNTSVYPDIDNLAKDLSDIF